MQIKIGKKHKEIKYKENGEKNEKKKENYWRKKMSLSKINGKIILSGKQV